LCLFNSGEIFSRRHVEIANFKHIAISGMYAFIICFLILIQPDFGGALIVFCIWFGMVLVSGISKKHLIGVAGICIIGFGLLWGYALKDYQKQRIMTFVHPLADIRGAGYNAYQSTIAVGSGKLLGKGIGYGTQSRLSFLPEYQTDFIFAAFSEEWGFIGSLILVALYGVIIWRILSNAVHGVSNFEILYGVGIAILFMTNFIINVGMNIGLIAGYRRYHSVYELRRISPRDRISCTWHTHEHESQQEGDPQRRDEE
jgi:rod shape determining protein RodA